jgi:hypothetical protein
MNMEAGGSWKTLVLVCLFSCPRRPIVAFDTRRVFHLMTKSRDVNVSIPSALNCHPLPSQLADQRVCFLSISFCLPSIRFPPSRWSSEAGRGGKLATAPPVVVSLYSALAGVTLSSCGPLGPQHYHHRSVFLWVQRLLDARGSWPHASAWQATREFGIAKRDPIFRQRSVKLGTSYCRVLDTATQIAKSVNWFKLLNTQQKVNNSLYCLYMKVDNITPSVTIYLSRVMLWLVANSNKISSFFTLSSVMTDF